MKPRPIWTKFVSLQEVQFLFGDVIAKEEKETFSNINTIVYFYWGGGKNHIRKFRRTTPKMANLTTDIHNIMLLFFKSKIWKQEGQKNHTTPTDITISTCMFYSFRWDKTSGSVSLINHFCTRHTDTKSEAESQRKICAQVCLERIINYFSTMVSVQRKPK